jgi:hypothetical protein
MGKLVLSTCDPGAWPQGEPGALHSLGRNLKTFAIFCHPGEMRGEPSVGLVHLASMLTCGRAMGFDKSPACMCNSLFTCRPSSRQNVGLPALVCPALLQMTGHPLHAKRVFGKPNPEPYTLIEALLLQQAQELGLVAGDTAAAGSSSGSNDLPFSSIYAVGDNPAADVRGATQAGAIRGRVRASWLSKV